MLSDISYIYQVLFIRDGNSLYVNGYAETEDAARTEIEKHKLEPGYKGHRLQKETIIDIEDALP